MRTPTVFVIICFFVSDAFVLPRSNKRTTTFRFSSGGANNKPPNGPGNDLLPIDPVNKSDSSSKEEVDNNPLLMKWKSLGKEAQDDIKSSVVAFSIALLVRVFLLEPRFIPSLSMFPTFDIGDQLLVDKISVVSRPYQRRDVVVFNPSETYIDLTGNTEALIKRVVAVEGDIVEIKSDHRLYVNGIKQDEPYINEDPDYVLSPMKVPSGMLLVLGDNRNHSFDSHIWGFLPNKNVIGRAVVKYWPPWRVGGIEGTP
eukprot:gene9289-19279_t